MLSLRLSLVLSALLLCGAVWAQEGTIQQTTNRTVELEGLGKALSSLQTQVTSATTRLMTIKKCHEEGKFFGTKDDGTEGCIELLPSCSVPWNGAILQIGESITAFASPTVPYGGACQSESRLCSPSTGKLSGTFTFENCKVTQGLDCSLPWGGNISSTLTPTTPATSQTSVVAYLSSTVPFGSTCTSETRVCSNGTLSGSYSNNSCSETPPKPCTLPWGGTLAHGTTTTAYTSTSVAYGSSCSAVQKSLGCTNGTFTGITSGTAFYNTCSPAAPADCILPWGGTLQSGKSVVAFTASSAPTCSSVAQSRTCTNGVLTGNATFQTCTTSVTLGSITYSTPGSYTFTVPPYNTLKVEVWGAGGGCGSGLMCSAGCNNGITGGAGGYSAFGGMVAYGGGGGNGGVSGASFGSGGGGGGAGGGNAVNAAGASGQTGYGDFRNSYGGSGGAGAYGGGGGSGGPATTGNAAMGAIGNAPGGGGGGAGTKNLGYGGSYAGSGGGGGGYAMSTYGAGTFGVGSGVGVVVGAGGSAGYRYATTSGAGAPGRVTVTWY